MDRVTDCTTSSIGSCHSDRVIASLLQITYDIAGGIVVRDADTGKNVVSLMFLKLPCYTVSVHYRVKWDPNQGNGGAN